MPWRETSPMQERIRFVKDCRSGAYERKELCERYGIRRKTGYKWLDRFEADGVSGLGAPRRRQRCAPPQPGPFGRIEGPSALWCVDVRRMNCHPCW
jgi:transposase-like protein